MRFGSPLKTFFQIQLPDKKCFLRFVSPEIRISRIRNSTLYNPTQKFDKNGTPLLSHPWDNSKLIRYQKEKDKAWQNFNVNPSLRNYCVAPSKQQTFHAVEVSAKKLLETKIVKNLKHNSKPLYHYLNCKSKKSHLCRLYNSDGNLSQSSVETANILVSHFHSVFQNAEYGPLQEECYHNNHKTKLSHEQVLVITPDEV